MLGLRTVLLEQGRTQRWLAGQLGVHESLLSMWIAERRPMPAAMAPVIAGILAVPEAAIIQHVADVPIGTKDVPECQAA